MENMNARGLTSGATAGASLASTGRNAHNPCMARILVADVGGTKTDLALFESNAGPRAPRFERRLPSEGAGSFEALARAFLDESGCEAEAACLAVAGPVVGGRVKTTNLPWVIEADALQRALGLSHVELLNDLEAVAYAVPVLARDDLHTLNAGTPEPTGACAVIAPGTGLGEAYLTWDGKGYRAHASEGGHTDFGPTDERQIALLRFMLKKHERVSYERLCSGSGLPNLYAFLKAEGVAPEPDWLRAALAEADDLTPVIVAAAQDEDRPSDLCRQTLELFVSILGAEAGNLALKVLATGGVFLGGGMPPKLLPWLERGAFLDAFSNKGRFRELASGMPVHVILEPKAALWGAAAHALEGLRG